MNISKKKLILICSIWVLLLTSVRLVWMNVYSIPESPSPSQGVLDLKNWNLPSHRPITLNGEWLFYPSVFLNTKIEATKEVKQAQAQIVNVPGNWNDLFDQPISYGTYQLRIELDPQQKGSYGLAIPMIYSASQIFVNGEPIGQSGQPSSQKEDHVALETPYTVYFTIENPTFIDLIIHVSNFDIPKRSGILRSIQFGYADAIQQQTNFAKLILISACLIYLLHAIYSIVLYFVGKRDWRLLYFSLMILCIIIGTLLGENYLFVWFPVGFSWRMALPHIVMLVGGFSLLQCMKLHLPNWFQTRFIKPYFGLCAASLFIALLLPPSILLALTPFYILIMLIPCLFAPIVMFRSTRKLDQDHLFLLFAIIASIGSLIWLIINYGLGIEMISYPFDLLIALICFAIYWFKQYFRVLEKAENLAERLQIADRRKDEFLMNVSHEMKNPIHGILNITEAIVEREKGKLQPESMEDYKLIMAIGRRMSLMVNDLLDLESIKEERIKLQRNPSLC